MEEGRKAEKSGEAVGRGLGSEHLMLAIIDIKSKWKEKRNDDNGTREKG